MNAATVIAATAAAALWAAPIGTVHAEGAMMGELLLTSPAFPGNGLIPKEYTCDGADRNPPLGIRNVPPRTESLALIVDDPDAPRGTWVHWVVWNIARGTTEIAEASVPAGAVQGTNDFGRRSYGGPCPPSGTHRYFFKLYALDNSPALPAGATKKQLEEAMQGHILGSAELVGLYRRK